MLSALSYSTMVKAFDLRVYIKKYSVLVDCLYHLKPYAKQHAGCMSSLCVFLLLVEYKIA